MSGASWLVWRHLRHDRKKAVLLALVGGLSILLPLSVLVISDAAGRELTRRARKSPFLLGLRGSPLELTLASLYFQGKSPEAFPQVQVMSAREMDLADVIPLHLEHRIQDVPLVGTESDYFSFRNLRASSGRMLLQSGECVLGANAAGRLSASVGDKVLTRAANPFDLAGDYPLRMEVVGILARTGTPDDDVVFTSIRTSWIASGLGHGHSTGEDGKGSEMKSEGTNVVYDASVTEFQEITDENRASFHFHGDVSGLPVSAALLIPKDDKSATLLEGRFLEKDQVQLVRPSEVVDSLLETVVRARRIMMIVLVLMSVVMLGVCSLVVALSIQLRREEFLSLERIGASQATLRNLILLELMVILGAALAFALVVTAFLGMLGRVAVGWMLF